MPLSRKFTFECEGLASVLRVIYERVRVNCVYGLRDTRVRNVLVMSANKVACASTIACASHVASACVGEYDYVCIKTLYSYTIGCNLTKRLIRDSTCSMVTLGLGKKSFCKT